jgi:hypothetical protein
MLLVCDGGFERFGRLLGGLLRTSGQPGLLGEERLGGGVLGSLLQPADKKHTFNLLV